MGGMLISLHIPVDAPVAQSVEQLICNQQVGGSSPPSGSIYFYHESFKTRHTIGRLVSHINKISITNQCITVKCDAGDTSTIEALQHFYPVHSNRKKTEHRISVRNVPEALYWLRGLTPDTIHTAPLAVQGWYEREVNARSRVAALKQFGHCESPVVNEHLTLRAHQQLGREIAALRDRYCFFFDTRTGKTPLSLSIIHDDLQKHPGHKWLVICPLILIENAWIEDANKFVPGIKVVNCHGATKAKRLKAINSDAQIYITNTESFAVYKEYFDKVGFHGCIVDESSDMKSYNSKQSKAIVEFAHTVKRFYLLSGSPAPNGEWEYYMQLKAIDFYCVPPSWTQFKEYYFVDVSFSQYEQLQMRPDRKQEFNELLQKYAIYVDKEDCLTLPGREFIEVEFDMPEELKVHYRTLKNELYLVVGEDKKKLTTPTSAAKLNKLNQVTSGFVIDTQAVKENKFYGEDQAEWYMLSNYRFEKLKDVLSMCGYSQVLIWANYRKEFEIISSMLGSSCRCIYGATSLADKNRAIQEFKRGDIQYLVANPASADKGLTLTNCHICIYFSLNWSYELFKQSMERIYGDISSQPNRCRYYILIAKHTIDGILYHDVLQKKGDASYAILNHLKPGGT